MREDIQSFIEQMTLEEKAGLCSGLDFWHTKGIERLGIPSLMLTDGPHGLRKQSSSPDHLGLSDSVPATCFPSAAGLSNSWDRALIERIGQALGIECRAEDVAILLGPGANIKRSPLCGRNFEYFSEDPYLSSEMAAHHIMGVQSQGVGASLKHFAANNQEHRRMTVDAVIDERTLREIYLASFEGAVKKAKPWTVMCAYNRLNGEYCSEHDTLLKGILRREWGFDGFVVSDWGAVNDRVKGLTAGLELEMPSNEGKGDLSIIQAVQSGEMPEAVLDQAVHRLLSVILKAANSLEPAAAFDKEAHHRLARQAAAESMVLLKNEGSILPLRREGRIAVIGELAVKPRYQGGGSSHIHPTRLDDIFEEMKRTAGESAELIFAQGYHLHTDDTDHLLLEEAVRAAASSSVAVLFAGLPDRYESEGYDRTHLNIPYNQVRLIEALSQVQPNLVVVLSNGAPVEMPWITKVKGVLEAYLGGQGLGGAIADLLFGEVNPNGKLAETFPMRLENNPSYLNFPGEGDRAEYKEGLFVGYRYYDAMKIKPLFPFGYGLSYTSFDYTDIELDKKEIQDTETVQVHVSVKNSGDRAGKEIIQLYVRDIESRVIRPDKELKGFAKVELQPEEEKTVSFTLDKRAFAYYNVTLKDWHVETGEFDILIGKSSRDIVLCERIVVRSTTKINRTVTRNTALADVLELPDAEPLIRELLQESPFARVDAQDEVSAEMLAAFVKFMPLRSLTAFGSSITDDRLERLLLVLNGANSEGYEEES
ncbi:glycoside hydrolase family 3 C-terminal domain-containing protein [Paenibacillus durus]|uniref:Glycosyl hydrolase family 3 n=1 Tax=Paenibacillus durus TaxID=44251 RepID=A0A089HQ54_PAEDU|nr:glycoside hydrolase family 3 C-terminal domain-containing protein [Paenibacillus durus]AIQ12493.1 glycosyl hydrolase family 3 [Paenibacillus durus]